MILLRHEPVRSLIVADLNAFEVIQYVTALRDDQQLSRLRQDIDLRLRQHAMTDVPWVPDWLTAAGKTLVMNSPRIPELAPPPTTAPGLRANRNTQAVHSRAQ